MPNAKTGKREEKGTKDEVARERELQDVLDRVQTEKGGASRPANESPNDFVERKMREKLRK